MVEGADETIKICLKCEKSFCDNCLGNFNIFTEYEWKGKKYKLFELAEIRGFGCDSLFMRIWKYGIDYAMSECKSFGEYEAKYLGKDTKKRFIVHEWQGKKYLFRELAEIRGVSYSTIAKRIRNGGVDFAMSDYEKFEDYEREHGTNGSKQKSSYEKGNSRK